jgi:hypothetical protein
MCHWRNNICTLESEGALSNILKIPSYPCSTRRKPKYPKRLNPHGKCLTSEEFTLNRLKAAKEEEENFSVKEDKKKKRANLARAKKEAKIQQQLEKKMATQVKRTISKPHQFPMPTKKRATFVAPLVKPNMHG